MQGHGYLCKLGDKPIIIPSEPQKALHLSDSGGGGPLFDNAYCLFIGNYTLGGDDVPQVCDLSAEQLTFWGFEFKSCLCQLLEHGLQPNKMVGWILQEDDYVFEVYDAPIEVDVPEAGFH